MTLNIMGTTYTVNRYNFKDKPIFEKRHIGGYCDSTEKEIAIVNLETYPGFEDESPEYCRKAEKDTMRHEIVHAFLSESGLDDSSLAFDRGWAKNEEMVDWIAKQFHKILEVFKAADCL